MAKIQPFTEWLTETITKVDKVYEETQSEYYDFLEDELRSNYERIIDKFYASYNPKVYKRRESLKDLLCFERDSDGMTVGFDPSKISRRDGYNGKNGLYTTVFIQGYHGGAFIPNAKKFLVPWTNPPYEYNGNITPWEPRPWREYPDQHISHGWEPAVRSISPYRMWKSYIDKYNKGQYQKDFDVIWKRNIDKYF